MSRGRVRNNAVKENFIHNIDNRACYFYHKLRYWQAIVAGITF